MTELIIRDPRWEALHGNYISTDDLISTIETAWCGIVAGRGPQYVIGISSLEYLKLLIELFELRMELRQQPPSPQSGA